MAYVLPRLETKKDVDMAIKSTVDKVLVLRFGRETDGVCMQLDEIVSSPQMPAPRLGRVAGRVAGIARLYRNGGSIHTTACLWR